MKTSIRTLLIVLIALVASVPFACTQKDKNVVTIGAILPLTGNSAQYGNWIKESLQLGLEEINAHGGINGKQLEIIYEDDQANPKLAATAMEKLSQIDKVPLVFGSWVSSCVLAQAPIAERNKVVVMAEAISPQIRDAGDYIFRIQPDAKYYLEAIIPFLHDSLKIRTIAVLYVNNDFGNDQAKFFRSEWEKLGGSIVYEEGFPQGESDFKDILAKVRKSDPEAIFAPCYTEIGFLLKQAKEIRINKQFIASVPFENPANLNVAGVAAEGVIYAYHFASSALNSQGQMFEQKYTDKYGRAPEGFAVLAYDGIRIIAERLKKCGADPKCIKDELYMVKDFPGITGAISFDEYGEVKMPIVIKTVRNGQFIRFEMHDAHN